MITDCLTCQACQKADGGYEGTETRMPGSGKISSGDYTHYMSGMSFSSQLLPFAFGITLAGEVEALFGPHVSLL